MANAASPNWAQPTAFDGSRTVTCLKTPGWASGDRTAELRYELLQAGADRGRGQGYRDIGGGAEQGERRAPSIWVCQVGDESGGGGRKSDGSRCRIVTLPQSKSNSTPSIALKSR